MALAVDPWLSESVAVLVAMGPCAYVRLMKRCVGGCSFRRHATATACCCPQTQMQLLCVRLPVSVFFPNVIKRSLRTTPFDCSVILSSFCRQAK